MTFWIAAAITLAVFPINSFAAEENTCTPPWCAIMNLKLARLNFHQGEPELGLAALSSSKAALEHSDPGDTKNQETLNQLFAHLRDTQVLSLHQIEWAIVLLDAQLSVMNVVRLPSKSGWWAWLLNLMGTVPEPIIDEAATSAFMNQWRSDLERLRQFAWLGDEKAFQQAAKVVEKGLEKLVSLPQITFWRQWSMYLQKTALRQNLKSLDALIETLSGSSDTAPVQTPSTEEIPDQVCMGIYLMSLHEINIPGNTFGADFWIWSIVGKPNLQPLKTLEVVNARAPQISLYNDQALGEQHWAQEKVSGVFRHQWNETNFPFERNILSIVIEEGQLDTRKLVYEADKAGSNYSEDIHIDGYEIRNMTIESTQKHYNTGFGDPTAPSSDFAQLRINIEVARNSIIVFFKLHAALYAAFLVTAFCFLLLPNIPTIMTSINSAIVGALFASVINLRAADAVIGRSESVTLVDRLHFVSFAHFIVLWGIAVWVLMTRKEWDEAVLKRFSRRGLVIYVLAYMAANGLLIWQAATA